MFTRRLINLLLMVMLVPVLAACSIAAMHHNLAAASIAQSEASDPISGEWDVSFFVEKNVTPAVFTFKLDGDKVSGTANSQHTGLGKLRDGKWSDNKLSFTLDFASHESIVVTGALKDGHLAGEFRTEGFTSTWEAKRKVARAANETTAPKAPANPADPISGNWDATFVVAEHQAPVTLKLNLAGTKVTGTTESSVAGSGTISEGTWADNKLVFTMPGPHGPVHVSGELKDGKLAGTFDMAEMKGTWDAKRN